ncbi:MAG: FHA domain-containing protein [Myxococcota bacterium]
MTSSQGQRICTNCHAVVPDGHDYCGQCGARYAGGSVDTSHHTLLFGPIMTPGRAKLILIRGTDDALPGLSFHLNASNHTVGRRHGKIPFPDDPYVSPTHADFFYRDNALYLSDKGSLNGTYLRLTQAHPLRHGDQFMVGQQILQFERLELMQEFPMTDGTLMYVSPPRPYNFRIIQLLANGKPGTIYASPNSEISMGREGCDINFPDDRHVSRHHAKVSMRDGKVVLEDKGSRNGTYIRITDEHQLSHGDYVFIGQHLLRVEITHS